ncbi:MAG: hypothetical protein L0H25_00795 [Micrococcales bacterium]|nr:hypothetical protein [Micrococcales bacterium]
MPLSLLLTQQLTLLTGGVRRLERWEGITDALGLVARRLRSAWLVRWFGTAVPVAGLDLRVAIANLDELRSRYGLVTAAGRGPGGPNLTEPLLGAGGIVAGAFAAPLNAMVASVMVGAVMRRWWQQLIAALGWLSGGGLISGLLVIAAPLAVVGVLAQGIGGGASDAYDVLGALAVMALPLSRLWEQLSGRAPVRNPLVRQLVALGDRLAALLAQVLGVVAVAVTRIAPLVYPAVAAARSTIGAVGEIIVMIVHAVADLPTVFGWFLAGPLSVTSIVRSVVTAVLGLLGRLRLLVTTTLTTLASVALARVGPTVHAVVRYAVDAARVVQRAILDTPFVRWLFAVRGLAAAFGRWSRRPGPPPSPRSASSAPSPWVTSFPWPASVRALRVGLAHRPTVRTPTLIAPAWVGLDLIGPVAGAMRSGVLSSPPDPFWLGPARSGALHRFRQAPSIAGELRSLEARQQRTKAAALSQVFELAGVLAEVGPPIARAIALLAPAQAATVLPQLEERLDLIDAALRRIPDGHAPVHPTRELPEPDSLRPVIGRLVVRAAGAAGTEDRLRHFVDEVRGQLDARPYPAAASGTTADGHRGPRRGPGHGARRPLPSGPGPVGRGGG